ncbi:hypothetical protein [Cohaesibacter gelatinilyticus]|uniref:hypothetical protein n=1 Tax=Cohaesibacter gelatinilyticus TaxID=372072 RepID=UPI00148367F1|nr:hypothetical protein [Cohaesibacter gelatinilyticus]
MAQSSFCGLSERLCSVVPNTPVRDALGEPDDMMADQEMRVDHVRICRLVQIFGSGLPLLS